MKSREISPRDGAVLVPLVAVIMFFALYPQLALHRSERSVKAAVAPAQAALDPPGRDRSRRPCRAAAAGAICGQGLRQ